MCDFVFPCGLTNRFLKDRDPLESPLSSEAGIEQVLREVLFHEKDSASRMNHLVMVLPLEEDLKDFAPKQMAMVKLRPKLRRSEL